MLVKDLPLRISKGHEHIAGEYKWGSGGEIKSISLLFSVALIAVTIWLMSSGPVVSGMCNITLFMPLL